MRQSAIRGLPLFVIAGLLLPAAHAYADDDRYRGYSRYDRHYDRHYQRHYDGDRHHVRHYKYRSMPRWLRHDRDFVLWFDLNRHVVGFDLGWRHIYRHYERDYYWHKHHKPRRHYRDHHYRYDKKHKKHKRRKHHRHHRD